MDTIHLIGSGGFIGKAILRAANHQSVKGWSHFSCAASNYFNLLDPGSWKGLLNSSPQVVILLSWPGLPNYQQSFHVIQNLPRSVELLEKLIDVGLKRVVVAGTCYEYGLQNGPLPEITVTDPVNVYAIAKDSLRRSVGCLCNNAGVEWAWLRIFYPYGVGQNPNSLLPSIDRAVKANEPFFSMSSGKQIRDFVPVEEVARQLLLLAVHPKVKGIYNGGSGLPKSLREIAEERIAAMGGQTQLRLGVYPDRSDEPLAFWADMTKSKSLETELSIIHEL